MACHSRSSLPLLASHMTPKKGCMCCTTSSIKTHVRRLACLTCWCCCSVVNNEAGAGIAVAQRGAVCALSESRIMSNAQGGVLAAAGASVTADICQLGDNDAGAGIFAAGAGTLAKLTSSILMANGLSNVALCDAAAVQLVKCKASMSEAHGIEVRACPCLHAAYAAHACCQNTMAHAACALPSVAGSCAGARPSECSGAD